MTKPPPSSISAIRVAQIFLASALILLALDITGGRAMAALFHSSRHNVAHVIASVQPQLVLYGSSTAARGLDPAVFEQKIGARSYSFAQDGTDLFYAAILMRNLPPEDGVDYAVWSIDPAAFVAGYKNENFKQLIRLAPYLRQDEVLARYLSINDELLWLKKFSNAYPYIQQFKQAIKDRLSGRQDSPRNFVALKGRIDEDARRSAAAQTDSVAPPSPEPISAEAVEALGLVAAEINKRGIRLVLVMTPVYGTQLRSLRPEYAGVMKAIAAGLSGPQVCDLTAFEPQELHDFTADPAMFYDGAHLNAQGAAAFSALIADQIAVNCFDGSS